MPDYEIDKQGYVALDSFHRTSIACLYAAGDNTTPMRTVSVATAAGTKAGAFINKELIDESFLSEASPINRPVYRLKQV